MKGDVRKRGFGPRSRASQLGRPKNRHPGGGVPDEALCRPGIDLRRPYSAAAAELVRLVIETEEVPAWCADCGCRAAPVLLILSQREERDEQSRE